MAGSIEGGRKAAATNKAKDPDFYKKVGALGGAKTGVIKGFAAHPGLASAAGKKGGRISKRGRAEPTKYADTSRDWEPMDG